KFAKDVPSVTFKGALLNGQIVPATEIQAIAALPSRDEVLSKLLYLMQHPIRGLATVLNANIRNLAVVIDQIAKAKRGSARPPALPPLPHRSKPRPSSRSSSAKSATRRSTSSRRSARSRASA